MAEVRRSGCVAVPGALTSENFRRLIAARDCEAGDGWFAWMGQYLSILSYQQRSCLKEKLVESDIMRWSTSWYVTHLFETALDTFRTLGTEHHCFPDLIWTLSACASQGAPLGSSLLLRTGPSGYSMGWSLGQEGSGRNRNNQSFI